MVSIHIINNLVTLIYTFAQETSDPVTQKFKRNLTFINIINIFVLRLKRSLILKYRSLFFFFLICVRTKDHMGKHIFTLFEKTLALFLCSNTFSSPKLFS